MHGQFQKQLALTIAVKGGHSLVTGHVKRIQMFHMTTLHCNDGG